MSVAAERVSWSCWGRLTLLERLAVSVSLSSDELSHGKERRSGEKVGAHIERFRY